MWLSKEIRILDFLPVVMLLAGLYLFPFSMVDDDFSRMPGDKGDARFNNYILEHGYKYMKGEVASYWDAPFLYPYKKAIAFSDNLIGTLPVYAFFRENKCDRETAFQAWFIVMFALNFIGCYLALRWWAGSTVLASVGAYIYAFSIFILCHINHVQILPRFMIPLVIYWTWTYLRTKKPGYFLGAMLGLVFQFYCGIYLGFFLVYMLLFMCISYLVVYRDWNLFRQFRNIKSLGIHLLIIAISAGVLLPMFQPYIDVSGKFGYRNFEEVSNYIPTWRAYFSATPESSIWRLLSWHIRSQQGYWWEQLLFTGLLPWIAVVMLPLFIFNRKLKESSGRKFIAFLTLTFFLCVIFSLKINGFTLYKIIFNLPGYGSMRSINRLSNAVVFLQVILMVFIFSSLIRAFPRLRLLLFFLPLLVIVDNSVSYWERTFSKKEVQMEVANMKAFITSRLDTTHKAVAVQHFNYAGMETVSQLNVMLASQDLGISCVNAYTGLFPYNYQGFADTEGMDSLKRWLDYNHADISQVQVISEFGQKYLRRKYGKIAAANNKYLTVNQEKNQQVFADSKGKEEAVLTEMSVLEDGYTILRAGTGKYFCAEISGGGELVANRESVGAWERFVMHEISPGQFTLKAANGYYIRLLPDASLSASSAVEGPETILRIEKK